MSFVKVKCPSCGANVDLDATGEYGYCAYCGTKIVRDKIVMEHRGEVSVNGIATKEAMLRRAQLLLEDRKWKDAFQKYEEVLNVEPHCSKAYIGQLLATTECMSLKTLASFTNERLHNMPLYNKAKRFANEEELSELLECEKIVDKRFEEAIEKIEEAFRTRIAICEKDGMDEKLDTLRRDYASWCQTKDRIDKIPQYTYAALTFGAL